MDSSLYLDGEIANIYHRQFHTVYRVCLSFMKNTEDAEDMVQETFLKLMNCEMQFESEEHERAWLIVTASNTCKNELREVDLISLGGIAESPEYQACSEWRLFQENYDADGTIRAEIGNGFAGLAEEYELVYGCYTQEMADEVDRLCEKYGLSRLTDFSMADDYDDLCRQAKVGNFCRSVEGNTGWFFYGGYVYADQTFYMEGKAAWKGSTLYTANYGLTRTMKSSFHPVTLNIGAIEDYHEWNYTTGNGQNVLLANSNSKALILAEREQSFLVVNVWDDFASDTIEISDEMLEGLADIFDFSEIP